MTDAVLRNRSLYDEDFFLWTQEQARLLRERRFNELDMDNLVDEVASVGRWDKRDIESRLEVLLTDLLKWRTLPGGRYPGWQVTIDEQRRRLARLLKQSPSLHGYPADAFEDCYLSARLRGSRETGVDFKLFPERPPFTVEQALDDAYLPEERDQAEGS